MHNSCQLETVCICTTCVVCCDRIWRRWCIEFSKWGWDRVCISCYETERITDWLTGIGSLLDLPQEVAPYWEGLWKEVPCSLDLPWNIYISRLRESEMATEICCLLVADHQQALPKYIAADWESTSTGVTLSIRPHVHWVQHQTEREWWCSIGKEFAMVFLYDDYMLIGWLCAHVVYTCYNVHAQLLIITCINNSCTMETLQTKCTDRCVYHYKTFKFTKRLKQCLTSSLNSYTRALEQKIKLQ